VVALNAEIVTDQRTIAADKFFTGLFETARKPGEIITAVKFRVPEKAAYMKFPNPASRYALVGVFVAKFGKDVRVAVTGAGSSVFRVTAMEQALAKNFSADALSAVTVPATDLNSDIHAAADYRAHLISVMAKRAVTACG
jgi:carbon-monoxide dehydrogenase medium subunit